MNYRLVFILSHIDPFRGYQDINLLNSFCKLGFRVYLYTPESSKKNFRDELNVMNGSLYFKDICVVFFKEYLFFGKSFPLQIYQFLVRDNPHVIWVQDFYTPLLEINRFKQISARTIVYFAGHSDFSNSANIFFTRKFYYPFFIRLLLKFYSDCVDKFLPVNPSSGLFLSQYLGIAIERIELFPLSLDVNRYAALRSIERGRQRASYGLSENDIVFVSGGQLQAFKQTHDLIIAFKQLSDENIKLFIFGNFIDLTYEVYLLNLMKGDARIKYFGSLSNEEVNMVMLSADVAIFPSSQTVLWQRSLALSLVLVIGRYINIHGKWLEQDVDYLVNDDSGFILQSMGSKVEEIQNLISNLVCDRDLIRLYQEKSLNRAFELIDIENNIKKILQFNFDKYTSCTT
jgi:1,2-diacylglycerol 3-alpha-glucosyltransferase